MIPPKQQLFLEDEVIVVIELKETMLVLYIVSGTGGLWLILVLIAFICDRRHKKKVNIFERYNMLQISEI